MRLVVVGLGEERLVRGDERQPVRGRRARSARPRPPAPRRGRGAGSRHRAGRRRPRCSGASRASARSRRPPIAQRGVERAGRPAGQRDQARAHGSARSARGDARRARRAARRNRRGSRAASGCRSPPRSARAARRLAGRPRTRGPPGRPPRSATESCMPAIGWMPMPASFSENSSAPKRLLVSVSASAGCRSAAASFARSRDLQRALEQRVGRVHVQVHEADVLKTRAIAEPLRSCCKGPFSAAAGAASGCAARRRPCGYGVSDRRRCDQRRRAPACRSWQRRASAAPVTSRGDCMSKHRCGRSVRAERMRSCSRSFRRCLSAPRTAAKVSGSVRHPSPDSCAVLGRERSRPVDTNRRTARTTSDRVGRRL